MTPKKRQARIEEIKDLLIKKNFNPHKTYTHIFYNDNKSQRFKFTATKLRKEKRMSYGGWMRLWSEYIYKIDFLPDIPIF